MSVIIVFICAGLAVSAVSDDAKVDVVGAPDVSQSTSSASVDVDVKQDAGRAENKAATTTAVASSIDTVDDHNDVSDSTNAEHLDAESNSSCFLRLLSNTSQHGTVPASNKSGAVFWKSSWRQHLCRCPTCLVNFVVRCTSPFVV